ncbi:MAG: hypothetical protein ASARMPRED_006925 [Alectoria sarmentosa]|nr:MAG: hypothetical protein ASARMPRED_006925 [Alectoria sarmentosa]
MDPVSPFVILGAVTSAGGAAFNVSTKLYSFIKATKAVDKSVEALYREVKGLETTLYTAQRTLTKTVRDHAKDPALSADGIMASIENGAQDCRVTVEALNSLVQDVGTNNRTTNPFKKMLKQLKLNLSTDQIEAVRGRVHTHSICLQLSLQTLAVALSCSSPTSMNGTVALDLEVITSKLDHLASTVARAHMAQSSEEAQLPKIFQNPDLQDHTRRLRISANAVLSNASTVIDAGSSQEGGSQYIPTTFSEFGVPLDNAKRSRIEEWTQNTVIGVEEYGSIGGRSDKGGHSSTSIDRSPTSNNAERYWTEANYLEAEKFLRAGMNRVTNFVASKQQNFDLNDVSLKLAFTRLHQADFDGARKLFDSLLDSRECLESFRKKFATTDEVSHKNYAYFGLAQIYLCQNLLTDAEFMCQRCIDHWEPSTDTKVKNPYSKSLQLMACIHEAKGDSAVARIFSELAVAEGLESNGTTPYMLEVQRIQVEIESSKRHEKAEIERATAERERVTAESVEPILLTLDYPLSKKDFNATHALTRVAGKRSGKTMGPGKLGQTFSPTAEDIAKTVKYLLAEGANGDKALGAACEKGNILIAQLLCDSGADVNTVDKAGWTPILRAARCGKLAVVKFLCDRGADLELAVEDKHLVGVSPSLGERTLHLAATSGHAAVVELLLERGAHVNSRDRHDYPPLYSAVFGGHLDVVKTLCDAGADLEARDNFPLDTPLTYLLRFWHHSSTDVEILKILCESGADVSAITRDGRSALDVAKLAGRDVEKVLMQYCDKNNKRKPPKR